MALNLNPEAIKAIEAQIKAAWSEVTSDLDQEYTRVIESTDAFPGFTGQDIVDTGRFRDSQTAEEKGFRIEWNWNPEDPITKEHYAAGLYFGFVAGRKFIPGRPWVDLAVKNVQPVKRLGKALERRGLVVTDVNQNQVNIE